MTFLDLVLIALAGWRFAYFITKEDGPGNVMGALRKFVVRNSNSTRQRAITRSAADSGYGLIPPESTNPPPGSIGAGITCFRCMSVWGVGFAYSLLVTPNTAPIVWIAAGSAASILVSEWVGMGFSHEG